jgi:hypothetical protein
MYRFAVRSLIAESWAYLREMISRVRWSYVSSRAYPLRQVAHSTETSWCIVLEVPSAR